MNIGKQSVNLFRDDELKTLILSYQNEHQKAALAKESLSLIGLEQLNQKQGQQSVYKVSKGNSFLGYGAAEAGQQTIDIKVVLQGEKGQKGQQALKQKLDEFQKAHQESRQEGAGLQKASKATLHLKKREIAVRQTQPKLSKVIRKKKAATRAPTPARSKALGSPKKGSGKGSKAPKARSAPASKK